MKFFENKSIFRKITIAILIVTLFSFIFSGNVRADADEVLIKPIVTLLNSLGDGVMDIVHSVLLNQSDAAIRINIKNSDSKSLKDSIFDIAIKIAIVVGVGVAIIATAGIAGAALGASALAMSIITGGTKLAAVAIGSVLVFGALSSTMGDVIVLPMYNVTPEMIFSTRLPIFDVDFFNPDDTIRTEQVETKSSTKLIKTSQSLADVVNEAKDRRFDVDLENFKFSNTTTSREDQDIAFEGGFIRKTFKGVTGGSGSWWYELYIKVGVDGSNTKETYWSIAYQLHDTIASWYITLRNIALVGGLTILVYIGIRIITSSASSDKAKYKQRLWDWIVSMCLIFVMHYIMAGSNLVIGKISNALNSIDDDKIKSVTYYTFEKDSELNNAKTALENNMEKINDAGLIKENGDPFTIDDLFPVDSEAGLDGTTLRWPTSQMGGLRMMAQKTHEESTMIYFGYCIMYLMLVTLTIIFTITYFRRILYMAFLTLIAPLVAMTYSLDKLKDGNAQGFNMWFREYIINLIIQPIHLLLYTILIYTAIDIATNNPLYGIVALGFLIPAERLVRSFFGVPKTETQGFLSGPAGTALAMTGLNKLLARRPPEREKKGGNEDKDAIRFKKESLDEDSLFGSQPTGGDKTSSKETIQNPVLTESPKESKNEEKSASIPIENKDMINKNEGKRFESKEEEKKALKNAMHQAKLKMDQKKQQKVDRLDGYKDSIHQNGLGINKKANGGRSFWGGVGNVFASRGRDMKRKLRNPKTYDKAFKGTLGLLAKGGGVLTGIGTGALGFAFGAASGDPMGAFRNTLAGGFGGYKLGSATGRFVNTSVSNAVDTILPSTAEAFEQGFYENADDYDAMIRQRETIKTVDEILDNKQWIEKYARIRKLSIPKAKKELDTNRDFLERGVAFGFNDANEFAAAQHAKEKYAGKWDKNENPDEHAFKMVKLAKRQSNKLASMHDSEKDRRDILDSYAYNINPTNPASAKGQAEELLKQIDEVNTIFMKK